MLLTQPATGGESCQSRILFCEILGKGYLCTGDISQCFVKELFGQTQREGRIFRGQWMKRAITQAGFRSMKASFHIYLYGRCKTCYAEEKMKNHMTAGLQEAP